METPVQQKETGAILPLEVIRTLTELDPEILMQEAKRQADINVERWERCRARARERAERKAAKKNLSAVAVM